MGPHLAKLLAIGSQSRDEPPGLLTPRFRELGGAPAVALEELLTRRNGFIAFERALLVLPAGCESLDSLERWNSDDLWRHEYGGLADGLLFFAEDVFCVQFAIAPNGVFRFDPETGVRTWMAPDLDGWADIILSDFALQTGWPLAHDWQVRNGPIPPGCCLAPKIPFVLGGEYAVDALWACNRVERLRFGAALAVQLRNLPPGTRVELVVANEGGPVYGRQVRDDNDA